MAHHRPAALDLYSLALFTNACALPAASSYADWPMLRHDAQRSGKAEGPAPTLERIVWSAELPGPVDCSPAVCAGTVAVGTAVGTFHALQADTGAPLWTADAQQPAVSSPCIVEGHVVFGSVDGYIHALDLAAGTEAWRFRTERAVTAPPLAVGASVVVGSTDGRLYALGAADGHLLWQAEPIGEIHAGAAATEDLVVYADVHGRVHCVRVTDGAAVWARPYQAQGPVVACPVIDGGAVVIPSLTPTALEPQPSLVVNCLDLETGQRLWGRPGGNPWQQKEEERFSLAMSPLAMDGLLWFIAGEDYGNWKGFLFGIDSATGARKSVRDTWLGGQKVAFSDSSPAAAGSLMYFADYSGVLWQVDATTRRVMNRLPLGGRTCSSPAISDGRLYLGMTDGRLLCVG